MLAVVIISFMYVGTFYTGWCKYLVLFNFFVYLLKSTDTENSKRYRTPCRHVIDPYFIINLLFEILIKSSN